MSKANHKICGHTPVFYVPQPYFLKHSPLNPFFGAVHDGVSTGWLQGYSVKPIHWLYRFRHNLNYRAAPPLYLRNPLGKDIHWLEVSIPEKFRLQVTSAEAWPHMVAASLCISLVIYQAWNYIGYHPELSMFNLVVGATKKHVKRERFNDKIEMDEPVFRWFQRVPEFYAFDSYRELIKLGVIANDPWIEFVKKHGRERELTLYCHEKGWGEGGQGKLMPLLEKAKKDRQAKEQHVIIHGPRGDHAFGNDHGDAHGAHH